MKTFERLLLRRLKPQVEGALDPLQFAYQDSMGVDDAILAFDTIQPQLLKGKLERMGVDPVFVRWIHNYLTLRSQYVRMGDSVSGILTSNTKYSDDTAIVACVKGRDENEYRELITRFTSWSRKPAHQPVIIDGEKIEVVDTYKYLGVHLDHKLDWSEQARALYKKGQSRLFFLKKA
ncbi:hypothetical protein WMY93_033406 [Mugilogobius chulae]|uniref:Reverse transcriptase n=1 Tax=Mugilogobius chulae TaxID=88201 RepID=A0AAW0ML98_9GOBI